MWQFALVQRLTSGKVVALRHQDENEAVRGLRADMAEAWMFRENSLEQFYGEVLYVIFPSGTMVRNPGIHEVPHDVIRQLSPPILMDNAA